MFRARPNVSVRLKSRPKSKPLGRSHITTRETLSRGRPSQRHATRARPKRASREQASRPRNPLAYHGRCIRPSREERPTSGREFHRPNSSVDHAGRPRIRPTPTVPTRPRPDCPADRPDDRPNAAVDPKPVLKPKLMFSSPA
ncbi:unnamed protein product [Microthlaspi erraticum]|uniref:Uncharacterized protein n=1 Tax=Microthlaspi erraticum TaxID=1685480 RepID=A0A6D2IIV6_9BRAS|nr:unnamed protein product [Microthlaspi erraticum]